MATHHSAQRDSLPPRAARTLVLDALFSDREMCHRLELLQPLIEDGTRRGGRPAPVDSARELNGTAALRAAASARG